MIRRWFALAVLILVSAAVLFAAETRIPPMPNQWVTDTAGFLSPQVATDLNARLRAFEQQSGHQVLVYIGQTTGDTPIEQWASRAFEKWKVGRKGIDDGLVLFIMAQDRKLKIEVGYGLEAEVPDIIAGRIINDILVPRILGGDRDGAVTAGIDAMAAAISGQDLPAAAQQPRGSTRDRSLRPLSLGQIILYGIIGIVILIIFITNPSLAIYLLMSVLSNSGNNRRGGGWSGGGGGGFGGGGGRSGGGGASGSW